MSRIGLTPITIPSGVSITLADDQITVKGPKGELTQLLHHLIQVKQDQETITVSRKNDSKIAKSLHGTYQSLISNMVEGVSQGFQKKLELVGTGYRVAKQGKKIVLSLGFSHPVEYQSPESITLNIEGNNQIIIEGPDKQVVGQTAATIRSFRPPEPYKGKGVRYQDEVVRRKAGKAAKAGA